MQGELYFYYSEVFYAIGELICANGEVMYNIGELIATYSAL